MYRSNGMGSRSAYWQQVRTRSDLQRLAVCREQPVSAPFWKKAKWRSFSGRPIENHDLWDDFLAAKSKAGVRVDIIKVVNKSTPLLKLVDKLAKAAAKSHPRKDLRLVTGKIGRSKIKGNPTLFPANEQVIAIRVVRSKAVGPTHENRFVFETFDETAQTFISKHVAYCTPEIGCQLHRQRGFRVRMNDDPKYPQIIEVLAEIQLPKSDRKRQRQSREQITSE